jgi:hypothetical protein
MPVGQKWVGPSAQLKAGRMDGILWVLDFYLFQIRQRSWLVLLAVGDDGIHGIEKRIRIVKPAFHVADMMRRVPQGHNLLQGLSPALDHRVFFNQKKLS